MFLEPAGREEVPPFEAGRDHGRPASRPLTAVTHAVVQEAFGLRGRYGAGAEAEIDRRIALAMQDCRMDEVDHLWAVWLALKGQGQS